MSRILITGCSGFIGSRIAIKASQLGYEVVATSRSRSEQLQKEMGMSVQTLDVLEPISIEPHTDGIDAIIHCATANDVLSRDFQAGVNLSVNGTRNILEFAVQHNIKKVIFFSTLQVYGTELNGEINEDTIPCCQSPYGLNHLYGEELCKMYAETHGLDVVLARPSNVYGFPDVSTVRRSTLVPMCFVKEANERGAITLRSSGRQLRNFISTDEVASACLYLLDESKVGAEVINMASNWLCSIRDIAEITREVYKQQYGKELPLNVLSDEPETCNQFVINSRLASLRPSKEKSRLSMYQIISNQFLNFK